MNVHRKLFHVLKFQKKITILSTIVCSVLITATSVQSEDKCSPLKSFGFDLNKVSIVKNSPSRDKTIEEYIRTTYLKAFKSKNSIFYSYNKVDLDGDSKPEILLRVSASPSPDLCVFGSCPIEILKLNGSRYSLIDSFLSYGDFIVTPNRTNGLKDILILYSVNSENMNLLFKYSSLENKYVISKQYNKSFKVKGIAYLACGKYFNLTK
jgi:hypothetical protein